MLLLILPIRELPGGQLITQMCCKMQHQQRLFVKRSRGEFSRAQHQPVPPGYRHELALGDVKKGKPGVGKPERDKSLGKLQKRRREMQRNIKKSWPLAMQKPGKWCLDSTSHRGTQVSVLLMG